jgi:hypothetical protein
MNRAKWFAMILATGLAAVISGLFVLVMTIMVFSL